MVEDEWTLTEAAAAAGVSVHCARKWVGRYRAEGELALVDRSSAPRSIARRTSEPRIEAIAALRRLRFTGPEIAEVLGMALSTVSGILTRSLTDNGPGYISKLHTIACRQLGIRHIRIRPYRPQTNGKAERFIRTLLTGWAYGAIYRNSQERTTALDGCLGHYNHQRQHAALAHRAPIARASASVGRLLRVHLPPSRRHGRTVRNPNRRWAGR